MSTTRKDANKNAKPEAQAEKTKDNQDLAASGADIQVKEGPSSQEGAAVKTKSGKKKTGKSSKGAAGKKAEAAERKGETAPKQKPEEASGEAQELADKCCGAAAGDHCCCQEEEPKP